jgi:hypothetical protein
MYSLIGKQLPKMNLLKIPDTARIAWNTLDDLEMERSDQESIFLATFDDVATNFKYRHQIDYSYYNRGYFEQNPKFILAVYTCGNLDRDESNRIDYFEKHYDGMHDALDDINHWLNYFKDYPTIKEN